MDWKTKIARNLQGSVGDKEALNRQAIKVNKGLKEVEKLLNRAKEEKKEQ